VICATLFTVADGSRRALEAQEEFGGDEVKWEFVAPVDNQILEGPIAGFDAAISKPKFRRGTLRIEWNSANLGSSWDLEIDGTPFQFATIRNGVPMEAGEYRLSLLDRLRPHELQDQVTVQVRSDANAPYVIPSIDSPIFGTRFPPHPKSIRFSGMTDTVIWLGIATESASLVVYRVEPDELQLKTWSIDVPWVFGSGQFQAAVFTANPVDHTIPPSDRTWFEVADDGVAPQVPKWVLEPIPPGLNPGN